MTPHPESHVLNQLEALARAYDREDASQRGEPDPWDDGKDDAVWVAERLACAQAGFAALSASQEAAPSEEPVACAEEVNLLRKIAEEIRCSAGPLNSHGVVTKWATGSLHEAYRDALEAARFLK